MQDNTQIAANINDSRLTPANASVESVVNSSSDVQHSSLSFAAHAIGTSFGALAGLSSTQVDHLRQAFHLMQVQLEIQEQATYNQVDHLSFRHRHKQCSIIIVGGGAVVVEVRMCIAHQRDKEEDQGDEEGVMAMDMVKREEEDLVDEDKLEEEEVQDEELEDEEEDVVD